MMPLAAVRAQDLAFLISISGAGIPAAETTIKLARNEMTARGMLPETVAQIVGLMKLQYHSRERARGGTSTPPAVRRSSPEWDRRRIHSPVTQDHPYWQFIRRLYFYDPAPTLRRLRAPVLALFGELDNNIVAQKKGRLGNGA